MIKEKSADERSLTVGSAIARSFSDSMQLSSSEAYRKLDQLASDLVSIGENEKEQREIQRRVAEAKVSLLYERKGCMTVFEKAWSDLLEVGFSNPEREASMRFYYIKFLLANGVRKDEIKREISRMGSLIDNNFGENEFSQKQHFLNVKKQLEDEFESSFKAT